jgi:hypothetical protein
MYETQLVFKVIKKIFDEWDPIAVISHAPEDEYEDEINKTIGLLEENDTVEEFKDKFTSYCIKMFGENYYKRESVYDVSIRIFNSIFTIISFDRIEDVKGITWHDAEILDGVFSYTNKIIKIPMVINEPKKKPYKATVIFYEVVSFQFSILEPWGAGMYISEVAINLSDNNKYEYSILLNSGDEIKIIAGKILCKKSNV